MPDSLIPFAARPDRNYVCNYLPHKKRPQIPKASMPGLKNTYFYPESLLKIDSALEHTHTVTQETGRPLLTIISTFASAYQIDRRRRRYVRCLDRDQSNR